MKKIHIKTVIMIFVLRGVLECTTARGKSGSYFIVTVKYLSCFSSDRFFFFFYLKPEKESYRKRCEGKKKRK